MLRIAQPGIGTRGGSTQGPAQTDVEEVGDVWVFLTLCLTVVDSLPDSEGSNTYNMLL